MALAAEQLAPSLSPFKTQEVNSQEVATQLVNREEADPNKVILVRSRPPAELNADVNRMVKLDNEGHPTDIEIAGSPTEVLDYLKQRFQDTRTSYFVQSKALEAIESFMEEKGEAFYKNHNLYALYARIVVTDKMPDLPDSQQYQYSFLDGVSQVGSDASSIGALRPTLYGTKFTNATPPPLETLLEMSKKKGVFLGFGSFDEVDLNKFQAAQNMNLSMAAGIEAGLSAEGAENGAEIEAEIDLEADVSEGIGTEAEVGELENTTQVEVTHPANDSDTILVTTPLEGGPQPEVNIAIPEAQNDVAPVMTSDTPSVGPTKATSALSAPSEPTSVQGSSPTAPSQASNALASPTAPSVSSATPTSTVATATATTATTTATTTNTATISTPNAQAASLVSSVEKVAVSRGVDAQSSPSSKSSISQAVKGGQQGSVSASSQGVSAEVSSTVSERVASVTVNQEAPTVNNSVPQAVTAESPSVLADTNIPSVESPAASSLTSFEVSTTTPLATPVEGASITTPSSPAETVSEASVSTSVEGATPSEVASSLSESSAPTSSGEAVAVEETSQAQAQPGANGSAIEQETPQIRTRNVEVVKEDGDGQKGKIRTRNEGVAKDKGDGQKGKQLKTKNDAPKVKEDKNTKEKPKAKKAKSKPEPKSKKDDPRRRRKGPRGKDRGVGPIIEEEDLRADQQSQNNQQRQLYGDSGKSGYGNNDGFKSWAQSKQDNLFVAKDLGRDTRQPVAGGGCMGCTGNCANCKSGFNRAAERKSGARTAAQIKSANPELKITF